ncbi:RNA polymerase II transcription initiation/nucleotide excision repair factor TFIIH, subunit TFB1 [Phaffia rhodozyma]|uniref:RNA polymerase II transcription initiation/nucleotide excision repair factor TFIIH, subunit TFB1 n=1 Tax=Phaffia rhodozyma TaxID=264483 RepID=A0A0F7SL41_PHARH|nr:RNA polymerase II transcription initiation/nucleotide excision repair factor TFIIH, subunit TFB1 [Phaffia rhodozyma]
MASDSAHLFAQASHKKEPGVLSVTATFVSWRPTERTDGTIQESLDKIEALFSSPPASGKHNLKITFNPSSSHSALTFVFTHPVTAPADAMTLKAHLAGIAALNKAAQPPVSNGSATSAAVGTSALASSSVTGNGAAKASPSALPSSVPKNKPKPNGFSASLYSTVKSETPDVLTDWDLHKKVLVKNPQLAALHYELVQTGQLSDAEFWEGRELLLLSESKSSTQSAGRSSQLIDDRWSAKDAKGKGKQGAGSSSAGTISLTPDLIRDIFDEFPEVMKAHKENVPKKVNETQFWSRYFNSRLWERHRASVRSSKQGTAKPDAMFDKYLEDPDDDITPRHVPGAVKNRFLDLAATEEDHGESGNARDITMQAGKQRSSLPLMRRFNEHSEKLLKAIDNGINDGIKSEEPSGKRPRLDDSNVNNKDKDRYAELDLDDLHTNTPSTEIHLDLAMQDRQKYFEGRSTGVVGEDGTVDGKAVRGEEEVSDIMNAMRSRFRGWQPCLDGMRLEKKAAEEVMLGLTSSVRARVESKSKKNDIPPILLKKTTTFHSTINEFLRQFWQAILPPPPSSSYLANSSGPGQGHGGGRIGSTKTPAEKQAKVIKMIKWLGEVEERVQALVIEAGEEGTKVRLALTPTVESVEKALSFYRSRKK